MSEHDENRDTDADRLDRIFDGDYVTASDEVRRQAIEDFRGIVINLVDAELVEILKSVTEPGKRLELEDCRKLAALAETMEPLYRTERGLEGGI